MTGKALRIVSILLLSVVVLVITMGFPHSYRAVNNIDVETFNDELNTNDLCSLREAIENANNDNQGYGDCAQGGVDDVIILEAGTYTLTLPGANENVNQTGDLDIVGTLTIQGVDSSSTFIQAGTEDPTSETGCADCIDRVLEVRSGAVVVLNDLAIQYGLAPEGVGNGDGSHGGGILNNGDLTLNNSLIWYNKAGQGGPGNINSPWGGWGGFGGGIYTWDIRSLTINNSFVIRNQAGDGGDGYSGAFGGMGGRGGGIVAEDLSTVEIYNSIISNNKAGRGGDGGDTSNDVAGDGGNGGYGGGIYCDDCELKVDHTVIHRNASGDGGDGGNVTAGDYHGGNGGNSGIGSGLWVVGADAELNMDYTTVSDNWCGEPGLFGTGTGEDGFPGYYGAGGGLYLSSGSIATIQTSTFYRNRGDSGGGILVGSNSTLYLINSTLSANQAYDDGGGLRLSSSTSWASLIFVTITNNSANKDEDGGGDGGGFFSASSDLYMQSTILYHNDALLGTDPDCSGPLVSQGYNLVGINSAGCTYTPAGTDLVGSNPLLESLGNNGGPTKTHALQASSPAINRLPSGTAGCGTTYTTDQRGWPRMGGCDSGSIEYSFLVNLPLILR